MSDTASCRSGASVDTLPLTIVIPIYNVEEYLSQCLASLPTDGCRIVLVNDGSTDNSRQIAEKYAATRQDAILVDKTNGGLSDARNAGMEYVDTPYVFFLDSDDWIDGGALMDALEYMRTHQLDWLQCGYEYRYSDYGLTYRISPETRTITRQETMESLVTDGYIKNFAWGKIYRTAIIHDLTFPVGKHYEDSFWQYHVVDRCKRLGIYPRTTTFYRQRQNSISGSASVRGLDLLEGLGGRLKYICGHYPDLQDRAAVNLWKTAMEYQTANQSVPEIAGQYAAVVDEIRRTYSSKIEKGIAQLPQRQRYLMTAQYLGHYSVARLLDFVQRVIGRMKPSEYIRTNYAEHSC